MASCSIAVASGKGGTGKTTIATNLSWVAACKGFTVSYLDCDVEEPNGHIFLKPEIESTLPVNVTVPVVDEAKCTGCGRCREICQYSAITVIAKRVLTFPHLCHGCRGCMMVCPADALSEGKREIGIVEEGHAGGVRFVHGRLKVGEAMSPPLIRKVREFFPVDGLGIIDAPPGTSCPAIQSVRGVDYVILVTEPTPFGLHDLGLAVEMLRALRLPHGVVVNRSEVGDDRVRDYCRKEGIEILLEIPNDRMIAEAYSRGILAVEAVPSLRESFEKLLADIMQKV